MRMVRGFYNEQNNTANVIHYDTNCIVSLDCGKWERGLRTSPNSQGKIDALAIDAPVEYVRLMLSGEMQVWLDALFGMVSHNVEHFFEKVRQKVESLLKKGDKSDAPARRSNLLGESQYGALFEKVRQKVEYFLEKGDESDAPVDRGFPG